MSPLKPLPYHFVDSTSTAAGSSRVSANADSVAAAVDVSTIETDVRYLGAAEPADVRAERTGSSWFWRNPPLPADRLDLALVFDLMGGRASPEIRSAGLADALFVLGAEADPGLVSLVRDLTPAPRVEPLRLSLPMIEVMPYRPGSRFAGSDYPGLREHGQRPFLFLPTGRPETYTPAADTPATGDYDRLH